MTGEHWIDRLGRALARGASRKDFLRLASGAILAHLPAQRLDPATTAAATSKRRSKPKGPECLNIEDCLTEPFASLSCCNGRCCPTQSVCMESNGRSACCPTSRVCDGGPTGRICCPSADYRCTVEDGCCPPGRDVCINVEGHWWDCCAKDEVCVTDQGCCPRERACPDLCCPEDQVCVAGSCCPRRRACGDICCPDGVVCKRGACRCDAKRCKTQNKCCDPQTNQCAEGTADHLCGGGGQTCKNCLAMGATCDTATRRCKCDDGSTPRNGQCPPTLCGGQQCDPPNSCCDNGVIKYCCRNQGYRRCCAGVCVSEFENCGGCGNACPAILADRCDNGQCLCGSSSPCDCAGTGRYCEAGQCRCAASPGFEVCSATYDGLSCGATSVPIGAGCPGGATPLCQTPP